MTVEVLNGVIVESAVRLDDKLRVSVPDLQDLSRNTYGPMPFRPYIAGDGSPRLPRRGDIAVIGIDSGLLDQWIITWHRDDHSNPPYIAGGGGPTTPTSYVHTQGTPATTWNVTHNLGFFPNVTAVDSVNREFIADVTYVDVNNLTITLTAATAGKAYVS